jgi:DNA-binding HxlR family transcriptional regulator
MKATCLDEVTDSIEPVGTSDLITSDSVGPSFTGPREESSKSCDAALIEAFRFLGKRWSGVILATLTNGPAGFSELARNVGGISDSVLSERLVELKSAGLVVRSVEPGPPVAVSYALSEAGVAIIPAMHALSAWASQNLPDATPASH